MSIGKNIFVESLAEGVELEHGIISYQILASYITTDIGAGRLFEQMRILIDIKLPLFVFLIKLRDIPPTPVRFGEVTSLKEKKQGIEITIEKENYSPQILKTIKHHFGMQDVLQLDRYELFVKFTENVDISQSIKDLKKTIIYRPSETLLTTLLDLVDRIVPEGFRVRYRVHKPGFIMILASENIIQDSWIRLAEKAIERVPREIPEEFIERLSKTPVTHLDNEKLTPWKAGGEIWKRNKYKRRRRR